MSATVSSSTWRRAPRTAKALALAILALAGSASAAAPAPFDPVEFFAGRTLGHGTLDELVGKARPTRTQSVGRIDRDGWLVIDQKVSIEGDPDRRRHWRLKEVEPGRYVGTLSDARGPVEAVVKGRSARIRYMMKGGIKVSQQLTPAPNGKAILNRATFRKLGVKVATLTERIEKH